MNAVRERIGTCVKRLDQDRGLEISTFSSTPSASGTSTAAEKYVDTR
jgi:hypothetical protein